MKLFISSAFILLLVPSALYAAIVNGGFEDGMNGWYSEGEIAAVNGSFILADGSGGNVVFNPFVGEYMAAISCPGSTAYVWQNYILQDIQLSPDDKLLTFAYNFWTYDESPFDNPGFLVGINGQTVFSMTAAYVGDGTLGTLDYSGWQSISIPIGQYYQEARPVNISISFAAGNTGDTQYASGVLLDDIKCAVPLPPSVLMFASGIAGLFAVRRKINLTFS